MTDLPAPQKRVWLKHPSLRMGAIASLVFLLIGFVSIAWVPYPIEVINVGAAMQDPSPAHWLGTDHLGRDMLSMIMKGTLTSFVVAAIAVAIGAEIGGRTVGVAPDCVINGVDAAVAVKVSRGDDK